MVDAGGEDLAEEVLHGGEVGQAGEPLRVPLLDVPPRVAEEGVHVEDRDAVQGEASAASPPTASSTSSGESLGEDRAAASGCVKRTRVR